MNLFDIIVVGAGIAGASAAAELARTHKVLLLEREEAPGYHSTGRSAALFSEAYGNAPVRALSRASRDFLYEPPQDFSEVALVKPRGALHVARADQTKALTAMLAEPDMTASIRHVCADDAHTLCPALLPQTAAAGGAYEEAAADVDVHALHQGYLRQFRTCGGALVTGADVTALKRETNIWMIRTSQGEFRSTLIVNAAGAWADTFAMLAGAAPLGIQPCRRTAVLIEPPEDMAIDSWPLTIAIDESWYFKPDAGLILLSPADETPVEPCDVQPEELDVAIAIDRIEQATTLSIRRVRRKWAGLRSFAPDRNPVIGFDNDVTGFFWLAGQGGYGIQTAPGAATLTAALIRGDGLPAMLNGFDPALVAPARFTQPRLS